MKILLVVLGLSAAMVLLLLVWPVRLAVRLVDGEMTLYWRPLPRWRGVRIFAKKISPPDVLLALADGDVERVVDVLLAQREKPEQPEKPEKTQTKRRPWLKKAAIGAVSAVRVENVRLAVALGGDPFRAAMLLGALEAAWHSLCGRVSCAVASWPNDGAESLSVGLLPPEKSLAQSTLAAKLQVRLGLGRVLGAALWRMMGAK